MNRIEQNRIQDSKVRVVWLDRNQGTAVMCQVDSIQKMRLTSNSYTPQVFTGLECLQGECRIELRKGAQRFVNATSGATIVD